MTAASLKSFPPLLGAQARILILGSMPGSASLAARQYYAHPRNLFWPFMGELWNAGTALDYGERVRRLQAAGVAAWDVLARCERRGSLDGSIVGASEIPNRIGALLRRHASIRLIAFNGGKAEQAFRRHIAPTLRPSQMQHLQMLRLPSTSPAHAALPAATKLQRWRQLLG